VLARSICGDPTETVVVAQATPSIMTVASQNIVLGVGQLSDQATVTGRVNDVGPQTVTFDLFAPTDPTCAGAAIFTRTVVLTNGVAQSAAFTPLAAGTYRWIAIYAGDRHNASVRGACGDTGETVVVARATPSIVTEASAGVVVGGGVLTDHAAVTGLVNPTGSQTVTFGVFGPSDTNCAATPLFTSTVALLNGAASSEAYAPQRPGTYRWLATYDGDSNNAPVSGRCNDATETRIVSAPPAALPPTGGRVGPTLTIAIAAIAVGFVLIGPTRRRRA
jgi:hypothetical protein